ncbi:hypothetical protein F4805DRAFT_416179 [Annulohypoxylon moriforme]|nr:hypothetical protein F4805DRAFT_416179 [Annulohypoxylon moriforme]
MNLLDPRLVKSGIRKGSGYKSGNHYYGGGGGGGGSHLPVWVYVVIVVSVVWLCLYLALFYHFFKKDREQSSSSSTPPKQQRRRLGPCLLHAAWKAFRYATPIQPVLWAVRKLRARFGAGPGSKNVGGTFYRKIEEGGEKEGQEQGVRDVNNSEHVGQVRGEPLMDPVKISKV